MLPTTLLRFLLLLLLPAAAPAAPPGPAATAEAVSQCIRGNLPATLQVKDFELQSQDSTGGRRLLQGRLYASREDDLARATLRLESPPDMRGAAYLMREARTAKEDEMHVFLPALNKTRRILGSSKDNPLFGTDISYSDIKQINHAFSGGAVTLTGREPLDRRPAWQLDLRPDAAEGSRFERIRAWVDQASCVVLKAEFIEAGQLRKRFTASADQLREASGHWYLAEARMDDLRQKTHTVIRFTGVKAGEDLAERLFNPRTFYLGG